MKLAYQSPEMDVISLATIQETMQSASLHASGGDLNTHDVISDPWDDLFN